MIRSTHSRLFRGSGGMPLITEAWGLDGWKGYVKGTSETSLPPDRSVRARLQQYALAPALRGMPLSSPCSAIHAP